MLQTEEKNQIKKIIILTQTIETTPLLSNYHTHHIRGHTNTQKPKEFNILRLETHLNKTRNTPKKHFYNHTQLTHNVISPITQHYDPHL